MNKPQPVRTYRYLDNRIEQYLTRHVPTFRDVRSQSTPRGGMWILGPDRDEAARCIALCNAERNGDLALEEAEKASYEKEYRTNRALFKIVGNMVNAFPCMKFEIHRLDYKLSRSLLDQAERGLRKRIEASVAKAQKTIADPKASAKDKKTAEALLERACDKLESYDEAY